MISTATTSRPLRTAAWCAITAVRTNNLQTMNNADYPEMIRDAQVYDVALETPLELANKLSARVNNRILMKREDLQPVFSFKLRGAYNKIASLSADEIANGVICSSASVLLFDLECSIRPPPLLSVHFQDFMGSAGAHTIQRPKQLNIHLNKRCE